eukprot:638914-Ditylum_brightwellii.AAC.1
MSVQIKNFSKSLDPGSKSIRSGMCTMTKIQIVYRQAGPICWLSALPICPTKQYYAYVEPK